MKPLNRRQNRPAFSAISLVAQSRRVGALLLSAIITLTGMLSAFAPPAQAQGGNQCTTPPDPCASAGVMDTTDDGRFKLTLVNLQYDFPNGLSTWTYRIQQQGSGGPALSHFIIGVCRGLTTGNFSSVQFSCNGTTFNSQSFQVGNDPTTCVYGIKFEPIPCGGTDFFVRFTINIALPATPQNFAHKSGGTESYGCILGPGDADPRTLECDATVLSLARLESFKANRTADGRVLLQWQTGYEVDNLGFRIYREENGKRALVTPDLVAGSALLAGSDTPLTSGQSYRWIDKRADDGSAQYWLEDVDLGGKSTWHGPIAVSSVIEEDVPAEAPGRGRARLLSSLGADADPSGAASYNGPVEAKAKLSRVTPELLARVPDLAGAPALKLAVKQEGWYRVTQPELVAAGLDAQVNPRNLQMYVDGQEVAIRVTGEKDGQFDAADAVEFYGVGLDSAASDTRIYWLAAGSGSGKRINTPAGRKGKRNPATSFPYTVERRDRTNYFTALRNGERENFFGRVVRNQPVDLSINVTHLAQGATEAAQLEVALQGVNDAPHQVSVLINGVEVGQVAYEGMTQGIARISLSNAMLLEGQNQVTLTALGSDRDVNLVDYIRLTYQHTFTADNNALRLPVSGKRKVTVGGLSTPALRVLDITDPADVAELSGKVEAQGTGYGVTFAAARAGQRTVLVVGEDRFQRPAAIAANQPSNLRDANHEADLVILTPREFFPAVEPLRAHRQGQGLAVAVVDIEDVYDEFSFGNKTPHAVRDFLAYAKDNWKKAPRFVLLGGDASFDPKNYLGRGNSDFVPTGVVDTATMETASDEWLADFTGDGLADLALGRLPARTPDEMAALVARVVGYDSAAKGENVVLVADRNDQFDFEAANAQIRALLPGDVSVTEIQRGRSDDATAKADVLQAINEGPGVVIYTGHGSTSFWRGNLLTSADAKELYNGQRLPLFVTMTCLNGYFHDPSLESLAESLMKAPGGGAIAVWASSGMTDPSVQTQMSRQLFWLLYDGSGEPLTLGEATARAKAAAGDADTRQTWILFGDPTTRLR